MIKTLRASKGSIQADVVIGANQFGGHVSVQVQLDRTKPDVIEALGPLEQLLVERANEAVGKAATELEIRQQADERVSKAIASERERIKTNAVQAYQNERAHMERDLAAARAEMVRAKELIERQARLLDERAAAQQKES